MYEYTKMEDIGVVIGRFQIDTLHKGHISLLDHVTKNHKKVIVFIGVAVGEHKEEQALGYATREKMIKGAYPDVVIQPLKDMIDDQKWSEQIDNKIREVYHHGSVVLYGGRDSFIPYYKGKFRTENVGNIINVPDSATKRREEIKREVRDSADFRAGIIYHAANSYPNAFPCVDVAVVKETQDDGVEILLCRKIDEKLYRFPGGFVDPQDKSYESAARRELTEEVGSLEVTNPEYITSLQVDDWRYRNSKNKIITSLFKFQFIYGSPKAQDDIHGVKWFKINEVKDNLELIVVEHRPLMESLLKKLNKTK